MPDYSIKEIVLITGGADAIREHEYPGDYEVSVLIDFMPLPGDLFRRVRALVRDRRLVVFPATLVGKDEVDIYPLLGNVRGVTVALASNQNLGGDGGLPTGLRLEEMLNLPNLYAQAPQIKPPKLPDGQKVGQTLYEDPKLQVRPGAPYAAFREFDGGPVHDGQAIAGDGTLFQLPKDPIERFLDALTPMIEKMAELTAIPVLVEHKPASAIDHTVQMPEPGEFSKKVRQTLAQRDRIKKTGSFSAAPVEPVDLGSRIQLVTVGTDRRVRLDLTDDELREMLVWHFREAMRNGALHYMDASITSSAIKKIADEAFRRVFSEIRSEVVITGRDVGMAL